MNDLVHPNYIGRFAPSPSGPLHQGSLVAALGSWLDARHHQGKWLLRIEDLDTPRNQPGAEEQILQCLTVHHLQWDGDVIRQSDRLPLYQSALKQLSQKDLVFPCACSRREIEEHGGIYPGTCREGVSEGKVGRAIRIRCPDITLHMNDRGLGPQSEQIAQTTGDFIVKRTDGVYSYQLAVVVDDIEQGVTQIVRGADLLSSSARQLFLYSALTKTPPAYLHLPLVLSTNGQKLSKQNFAPALNHQSPIQNILNALQALQRALNAPIKEAPTASLQDLLAWAIEHWNIPLYPSAHGIWSADQMEWRQDPLLSFSDPSPRSAS
jgi:glutamyl-Q tRNA(Asp) synthetase